MYPSYQQPPLHVQTTTPSSQFHQHPYTESPVSAMSSRPTNAVPSSPGGQSERPEEDYSKLPGPPPTSHVWNNLVWAIEIVQNPQRARMCGFGDKDRRPISPPPCIRVVIVDPKTGQEINYENIELSHLVLAVDIFDVTGARELNLVKQSNASPCISSSSSGAFPTPDIPPPPGHETPQSYPVNALPMYSNHPSATTTPSNNTGPYYMSALRPTFSHGAQSGSQPSQHPGQHPGQLPPFSPNGVVPYGQYPYQDPRYQPQAPANPYASHAQPRQPPVPSAPAVGLGDSSYMNNSNAAQSVYTRNLIGNLSASAFRLRDENNKLGIWFVLQDLSVRTEGWFRLKMNFFNLVKTVESQMTAQTGQSSPESTAPCLASVFSQPFKVFSAKKFPGVVESTELSRKFADQGIKIPIRKEKDDDATKSSGDATTSGKRGRAEVSDDEGDYA